LQVDMMEIDIHRPPWRWPDIV